MQSPEGLAPPSLPSDAGSTLGLDPGAPAPAPLSRTPQDDQDTHRARDAQDPREEMVTVPAPSPSLPPKPERISAPPDQSNSPKQTVPQVDPAAAEMDTPVGTTGSPKISSPSKGSASGDSSYSALPSEGGSSTDWSEVPHHHNKPTEPAAGGPSKASPDDTAAPPIDDAPPAFEVSSASNPADEQNQEGTTDANPPAIDQSENQRPLSPTASHLNPSPEPATSLALANEPVHCAITPAAAFEDSNPTMKEVEPPTDTSPPATPPRSARQTPGHSPPFAAGPEGPEHTEHDFEHVDKDPLELASEVETTGLQSDVHDAAAPHSPTSPDKSSSASSDATPSSNPLPITPHASPGEEDSARVGTPDGARYEDLGSRPVSHASGSPLLETEPALEKTAPSPPTVSSAPIRGHDLSTKALSQPGSPGPENGLGFTDSDTSHKEVSEADDENKSEMSGARAPIADKTMPSCEAPIQDDAQTATDDVLIAPSEGSDSDRKEIMAVDGKEEQAITKNENQVIISEDGIAQKEVEIAVQEGEAVTPANEAVAPAAEHTVVPQKSPKIDHALEKVANTTTAQDEDPAIAVAKSSAECEHNVVSHHAAPLDAMIAKALDLEAVGLDIFDLSDDPNPVFGVCEVAENRPNVKSRVDPGSPVLPPSDSGLDAPRDAAETSIDAPKDSIPSASQLVVEAPSSGIDDSLAEVEESLIGSLDKAVSPVGITPQVESPPSPNKEHRIPRKRVPRSPSSCGSPERPLLINVAVSSSQSAGSLHSPTPHTTDQAKVPPSPLPVCAAVPVLECSPEYVTVDVTQSHEICEISLPKEWTAGITPPTSPKAAGEASPKSRARAPPKYEAAPKLERAPSTTLVPASAPQATLTPASAEVLPPADPRSPGSRSPPPAETSPASVRRNRESYGAVEFTELEDHVPFVGSGAPPAVAWEAAQGERNRRARNRAAGVFIAVLSAVLLIGAIASQRNAPAKDVPV